MIKKLDTTADEIEFSSRSPLGGADDETRRKVRNMLDDVKRHGWEAVVKFSRQFDDCTPQASPVSPGRLKECWQQLPENQKQALTLARDRIKRYQEAIKPSSTVITDTAGGLLGDIVRPLERVGCYVPGGRVPLPSSVLMSAYIAEIAGVGSNVICSPPVKDGLPHPVIMAAVSLLENVELYGIGGVQAIGAMAYGAGELAPVDLIAGPGNLFVTLAKKEVYGEVEVDMLAGPSEIAIVGETGVARPRYVAADLLSQAEHDPRSRVYFLTPDSKLIRAVERELAELTSGHPREDVIRRSLKSSALIKTVSLAEAVEVVNLIAPEHLELHVEKPLELSRGCEFAGAVFCGNWSPEPVGDYLAGPSHTLPTGGSARFFSPLSVQTFQRHQSLISLSRQGFNSIRTETETVARMESLPAHEYSSAVRESEK
ncbi:MAG: histidinol dehydrogenase [bacterium]